MTRELRTTVRPCSSFTARSSALAMFAFFAACSGSDRSTEPDQPVATTMMVVAGDAQAVLVGTQVPTMPSVRVVDQRGNGIAGVTVKFTPAMGSGTVTSPSATTGADGVASIGWTLDVTSGKQSLGVAALGIATPLTFTATALTGPPAGITKIGGDGQTAVAGETLNEPLKVRVFDRYGNPLVGLVVFFNGTLRGVPYVAASDPTDANGVAARPAFRLDEIAGPQTITATAVEPQGIRNPLIEPVSVSVRFTAIATPRN